MLIRSHEIINYLTLDKITIELVNVYYIAECFDGCRVSVSVPYAFKINLKRGKFTICSCVLL